MLWVFQGVPLLRRPNGAMISSGVIVGGLADKLRRIRGEKLQHGPISRQYSNKLNQLMDANSYVILHPHRAVLGWFQHKVEQRSIMGE